MPDKTPSASTPENISVFSLAGSEWEPDSSPDSSPELSPDSFRESATKKAPEQFVQFNANNKISGFGGCNRFFGTYRLNGQSLTIGPLASTRMMCRDVMEAEYDFLSTLQAVKSVDFNGKTLTLKDEKGTVIRILRRRGED